VSKGNAEQPSAQTPKGPASPNRLETVVQARPEPGVQNRSQSGPSQSRPQPDQPGQLGNQQPRGPQAPVTGDAKLGSPGGGSLQPRPQQPNAERKPEGKAPSPQNPSPQNPAVSTSDSKPSAGPGAGAAGKPPNEEHKGSNGHFAGRTTDDHAHGRCGGSSWQRWAANSGSSAAARRPATRRSPE